MNAPIVGDFARADGSAADAARFLALLSNEKRLLVLCHLQANGEADASSLDQVAGLSAPALSQHLSKLRDDGIVDFRRNGQSLLYRIVDARIAQVFSVVKEIFCPHLQE